HEVECRSGAFGGVSSLGLVSSLALAWRHFVFFVPNSCLKAACSAGTYSALVMTAPEQPGLGQSRAQIFRVRGLTKVYGVGAAEAHALAGVDLDLYEGEFIVLLGPSGSGKTTLLNNLGGLDLPSSGELSYRGTDLTQADEDQLTRFRRERIGFIFQFYNLIPSLTARENVALITEI